jgi:hypothetical protein
MSQPPPEMNPLTPAPRSEIPSWPRLGLVGAFSGVIVLQFIVWRSLLSGWLGAGTTGWTGGFEYIICGFAFIIGLVSGFLFGVVVRLIAIAIDGQLVSRIAPLGYYIVTLIGGALVAIALLAIIFGLLSFRGIL